MKTSTEPSKRPHESSRSRPSGLIEQVTVHSSRCVDIETSAQYLGVSPDTVGRLIDSGALRIVKLPVERADNGHGKTGTSRRILIDVRDLDDLIERSKETR